MTEGGWHGSVGLDQCKWGSESASATARTAPSLPGQRLLHAAATKGHAVQHFIACGAAMAPLIQVKRRAWQGEGGEETRLNPLT